MTKPKTTIAKAKPTTKKNARVNLLLGDTLMQRASDYSSKSGIGITALLRNGLDLLLKQNNF